ncbi:hypothetical protein PXJ20_09875, partial [Paraburkholderia sp. A1RI_3L]
MGLERIGQVINDDHRVSAEPSVEVGEGVIPKSQEQLWHFLKVHDSEQRFVGAKSDALCESGARFTVALMAARERVGQADAPLSEFRVGVYAVRRQARKQLVDRVGCNQHVERDNGRTVDLR